MSVSVIILAAGKGTRMRSPYPKVLHLLAGEPLVIHVVETVLPLPIKDIFVVVGFKSSLVEEALRGYAVKTILQEKQLGTGDAVKKVRPFLGDLNKDVLVLCGDTPLLSTATLSRLLAAHCREASTITILTALVDDPYGYGRIIRNQEGYVAKIVEEKEASPEEKRVREINTGTYVFKASFLFEALEEITPDNVQGEYYLTDVVERAVKRNERVFALQVSDPTEVIGINSQEDLAQAEEIYQQRLRRKFMQQGVSLICPETIYLERRVRLGAGTIVFPHTVLRGETLIGEQCRIGSFSYLEDVVVGNGAELQPGSILRQVKIPPGSVVQGRFWR